MRCRVEPEREDSCQHGLFRGQTIPNHRAVHAVFPEISNRTRDCSAWCCLDSWPVCAACVEFVVHLDDGHQESKSRVQWVYGVSECHDARGDHGGSFDAILDDPSVPRVVIFENRKPAPNWRDL